jgi:tetratricopeptide repeat protein 8
MGINNAELWNNLGLACFYSAQYDMALNCFDRALGMASDDVMADIWYNVGHIGVALGDLGLAYQAFKITISIDSSHGEAHNNIAVLEMRRQKVDFAKSGLSTSLEVGPHLFEPLYNSGKYCIVVEYGLHMKTELIFIVNIDFVALLAFRSGDFQESFSLVSKALQLYPNHHDSKELKENLEKLFSSI